MAYERKLPVIVLNDETWGDDELMQGLEVKLKGLTVGQARQLMRLQHGLRDLADKEDVAQVEATTNRMLAMFLRSMKSWNMIEDGEEVPVPTTLEQLDEYDMQFVNKIVAAWSVQMTGVPDPLPKGSNGGSDTELLGSIPSTAL
jgi:hypothetical protein